MLRRLLAIVGGVFIGMWSVKGIESFSHKLHPAPDQSTLQDPELFQAFVAALPNEVFYLIIAAHAIGGFIAAFFACKMADANKFNTGLIAGAVMLALTVVNFIMIPHPSWVMAVDLLLVIIFAGLGAKMGGHAKSLSQ